MLLESDLLRTFVAVTDTGSFTWAAEVGGRTQSAVSLQMKRLEESAGGALFERGLAVAPIVRSNIPQGCREPTSAEGFAAIDAARLALRRNPRSSSEGHPDHGRAPRLGLPIRRRPNRSSKRRNGDDGRDAPFRPFPAWDPRGPPCPSRKSLKF